MFAEDPALAIDLPEIPTEAGLVAWSSLSVAEQKDDLRTRNADVTSPTVAVIFPFGPATTMGVDVAVRARLATLGESTLLLQERVAGADLEVLLELLLLLLLELQVVLEARERRGALVRRGRAALPISGSGAVNRVWRPSLLAKEQFLKIFPVFAEIRKRVRAD